MKKVLALVLAVMMLSTMAFASAYDNEVVDKENDVAFGGQYAPGDALYVYKDMDTKVTDSGNWVTDESEVTGAWNAEVTSTNYNVTNQRWPVGKELLAGLEFDDKNNQLKINLKEDYTLKQPKRLKGSFALKGKGKGGVTLDPVTGKKVAVKPATINVEIDITVGNWRQKVALDIDNDRTLNANGNAFGTIPAGTDIADDGEIYNNSVIKFTEDAYGTVVVNCADDGDTEVTFRGYKNDEVFLHNNDSADNALLKAYADKDAEISFLNFVANPTLNSTATIRFYKDEESHVYVKKDGKLVSEVKWDDDEDCFLLKTRTLGSYVFSDKALPFNVETTANPDTGANDVVGIATALAAVALVSAAAVSLKK